MKREGDKELGCVKAESGQGGATTAGRIFRALYCGKKFISHLMIIFKTHYSRMINQGPILWKLFRSLTQWSFIRFCPYESCWQEQRTIFANCPSAVFSLLNVKSNVKTTQTLPAFDMSTINTLLILTFLNLSRCLIFFFKYRN